MGDLNLVLHFAYFPLTCHLIVIKDYNKCFKSLNGTILSECVYLDSVLITLVSHEYTILFIIDMVLCNFYLINDVLPQSFFTA